MPEILIYLLIAVFSSVATALLIAARRPDEFYAARSMAIAAPASHLHGLISNLQQMNRWNPYALSETRGTGHYSGPDAGPGATYHFAGNNGTGALSVTDSAPDKIGMRLRMTKPMSVDNRVEFTLRPAPADNVTEVTWAMSGKQSLVGKIFSLFVDCDRMLARDFDRGLTDLKAIAEAA
ncbi:hypothetical protein APY04_3474 [Hyphomicrobium sulfonivorans]|uniref:Polyketide cyclase n=1 Tax=Hyphomicrobium sulfonivorans TaxID=121290 RepID=A0A120CT76_HYPSL|nr:SRPBCC family protein [Hyphomicrobium sulfonivorans]KWT64210.1 hypothetical protein APY04_3474 [Hyphomicrobium sulfonivorans]